MEANLSLMYVISLFSVLIAFAFAAYLFLWVRRQKSTNARINEVAALIKEGANTFMRKEYRVLSIFAGIAAVIIFLLLAKLFLLSIRVSQLDSRLRILTEQVALNQEKQESEKLDL